LNTHCTGIASECHHDAIIATWACNDNVKSEKTKHDVAIEKARKYQVHAENRAREAVKGQKVAEGEEKVARGKLSVVE